MDIWQDLRYALRILRKSPGFTIAAALTLALGIGANTAMFSVIRAVFLRPLSFPHEGRLVTLWQSNPEKGIERGLVTPANFVDLEARNGVFEQMGVWPGLSDSIVAFNIVEKEGSQRVRGIYASSGFFRALGVQPALGRTFSPDEDRQRGHRSAVIGHSYWRERFGGDPAILGKTIEVDTFRGGVYTIVGVMPAAFDFPRGTQIWLPVAFWGGGPLPAREASNRCCSWFSVVARLKPGVTLERTEQEMSAMVLDISNRYPSAARATAVKVMPLRQQMVGSHRTALLVLFGAVGCVLLIACVNVANLLLSRALSRRGEMAIRSALGATTKRLASQILVESLVLSGLGATAGIVLAVWAQGLLATRIADGIPLAAGARIDFSVLGFTIAIALASGGLCGIAPILQLRPFERSKGRSYTESRGAGLIRQALMVSEVALAVALVAGAGLLIRSVAELERVDPGFRAEQVLAMSFDFTSSPFRGPGNQQPYFRELMTRVATLPGVRIVGGVNDPPLTSRRLADQPITLEGRPPRTADESPRVITRSVTPAYFPALSIPLKRGRMFAEGDTGAGKLVAIVNETAARRYWPSEDPIGKHLAIGSLERYGYFRPTQPPNTPEWREIVGIVGDVRSAGLDVPPQPEVFFNYTQYPLYAATLMVRTAGDPLQLAAAIRREALSLNARAVVTDVKTMQQIATGSIAQPRFRAQLIGLFSALALMLGILGIYGVLSYTVSQRAREIGIRMALGAKTSDVSRMVIAQALRVTGIGLALGLAGAFLVARSISSLLYGVGPADPVALAVTCAVLGCAAVAASYVPARRAAAVDPASALRSE